LIGLSPGQPAQVEDMLAELTRPIALLLLREVSVNALSPRDIMKNLLPHLPVNQQLQSEQQAVPLQRQELVHPQTNSANAPSLNQQIDQTFLQQCERDLANVIGPIATFILQRALTSHPHSAAELVSILAAEIPDPQKAHEFNQRLVVAFTVHQTRRSQS